MIKFLTIKIKFIGNYILVTLFIGVIIISISQYKVYRNKKGK